MWPARIADQLRRRGHDVVAVAERSDLCGQPDAIVFSIATREGRVVVTENVTDYRPLAAETIMRNQPHPGLIYTSNRRYPRGDSRTAGRLVNALGEILASEADFTNREQWLS
jgi:hypothetical protein